MKKPVVIAIAAVSGGGKTTVVNELKNRLTSSKAIHFDDYDFEEGPEDYFEWVQSGADYNAWNIEKLAKDVDLLLSEENLDYILLDYPFAYKNDRVTPYIDYAIFIDTPLDIAMARRILRELINQPSSLLKDDLDCYLSCGRIAYLEMLNTIKPNSDFIVDGSLSVDEITNQIIEQINAAT
jgi:uridine kinase